MRVWDFQTVELKRTIKLDGSRGIIDVKVRKLQLHIGTALRARSTGVTAAASLHDVLLSAEWSRHFQRTSNQSAAPAQLMQMCAAQRSAISFHVPSR